ncbi:alpha/beta hydrolase [Sphingomonas lutea]|uniref:Alpha/beta hydrolase n=1 Tax=Sphingomonas lutea TaxID=1045317 RepID=A0A7G9SJX3_9SPHN|nr:alpha/beta hydrolase [Sphingomonas lutea]QNN68148.1 alpha/beta hydrolase [Sphingomonas lutea]
MSEARFADEYYTVRDGLRLHYRDYPGGSDDLPPLLCLHGLTRNARDFAHLAERYSPKHRVLVLEFRGRGDSEWDPDSARYNPLTYAGDVIELLDHLGLRQAIFVGTSLGGLVTMAVAALAPDRIAAAILNDIGPEIDQVGIDRIQTYLGLDRRFASWEEAAQAVSVSQGLSFPAYGPADWEAMARRNCRERDGEIVFDYDQAIALPFKNGGTTPTIDMWPLYSALAQKPLLVVRGEISQLLSEETFAKMQAAAPHAAFATVRGIGHAPELFEPEAIAAIDAFLGSLTDEIERTSAAASG